MSIACSKTYFLQDHFMRVLTPVQCSTGRDICEQRSATVDHLGWNRPGYAQKMYDTQRSPAAAATCTAAVTRRCHRTRPALQVPVMLANGRLKNLSPSQELQGCTWPPSQAAAGLWAKPAPKVRLNKRAKPIHLK
jgi:hypothetical protein